MNVGAAVLLGRSRRAFACAAIAVGVLIAGCGSGAGASATATAQVNITERDFHIGLSTATIQAGAATLHIHNAGPDDHELIVAPQLRNGLPLRSDGFTVNEEAIASSEPGSVEPQLPGDSENLVVDLKPGRYVLFCNMEGHFMAGMHTTLVVR
jgi:uncharacterized cupredoxin-like copper-binding protein